MKSLRPLGAAITALLCAAFADAGFISGGNIVPNPPAGLGNSTDTWVAGSPITSDGTLDTAIFGWSTSGACAMIKIKTFRLNGNSLDFVGESGPYTATASGPSGLTTVALSPTLSVHQGDYLGVVGSGAGGCGNPVGVDESISTAVQLAGDVHSSVSLGAAELYDGFTLAVFAKGTGPNGEVWSGIIPGAGSLRGGAGSNFKTGVQVSNPGVETFFGRVVVHAAGTSSTNSDAAFTFSLAPGATASTDDILAALGISGLATMDLYLPSGSTPPVLVARVYNDGGAAGTTGFTEEAVDPSSVTGGEGVSATGVLLGPTDVSRYRYNLGIRTLDRAVTVSFAVKDPDGNVVHSTSHDYPANYYAQAAVSNFLDGFNLGANESLVITVSDGRAILYGATVDNVTNDPSVQFMRYIFAIA
jgi:hypothetical protein